MAIPREVPKHIKQRQKKFSEVKAIGYFSVDGDRNYLGDSSKLLYYNPPEFDEVVLDLDDGIEKVIRRTESFNAEGISLLLKWITLHRDVVKPRRQGNRLIQPNFVCNRGLLIKFMVAPYTPQEVWKIYAAKWRGTIYLRSDKDIELFNIDDEKNKRFTSWGHKFEQYVLSKTPGSAPDTTEPVIEPEEFRCVYQRRFDKYSVLFSTVMKGVCSKELLKDPLQIEKLKFVDLKTTRMIEHAGNVRTLKRSKFLKWWSMGYLTNTENVLCGFRDDNGVVNKTILYNLDQMVTASKQYWDPEACISCCETFLKKLSESVINECDETIYEFTKVSYEDFNITELQPTKDNSVLPQWFMDAMN